MLTVVKSRTWWPRFRTKVKALRKISGRSTAEPRFKYTPPSREATNPAKILSLESSLRIGRPAEMTIIDPDILHTVDTDNFQSLSRNSPFDGWQLNGKPVLTMVEGKIVFEEGKTKES